jgi:hypothetical protein
LAGIHREPDGLHCVRIATLRVSEVAELLGVTRTAINARRTRGTLLRELDREEVSARGDLEPRSLARMHGPGLRRMKATAAVVQGRYEITWAWSRAIHTHPSRVDAIGYRAA